MTAPIPGRRYLLDANVFIESQKQWYRFDVCPGFWDCIVGGHDEGMYFSLDVINDELVNDRLRDWVDTNLPATFFLEAHADPKVDEIYSDIVTWVQSANFKDSAKIEFANSQDAGWFLLRSFTRA